MPTVVLDEADIDEPERLESKSRVLVAGEVALKATGMFELLHKKIIRRTTLELFRLLN